jgi:YD repeat-containing protein
MRYFKRPRPFVGLTAFLCILHMFIATATYCQLDENFKIRSLAPVSPSTSGMFKFLNYPVDLSTGLVDISIPIYTIVDGDIELPISLKYHASGFRKDDLSSPVGLGWTLVAEPAVTRSPKGRADEDGYFHRFMFENPAFNAARASEVVRGNYDPLPDDFYYSLCGQSGRFFFNKPTVSSSPSPVFVTKTNHSLQYNFTGTDFLSFEMKDNQGVLFEFGKYGAFERSKFSVNMDVKTSWKCNRIYSGTTNRELILNYYTPQRRTTSQPTVGSISVTDYDFEYQGRVTTDGISSPRILEDPMVWRPRVQTPNGCFSLISDTEPVHGHPPLPNAVKYINDPTCNYSNMPEMFGVGVSDVVNIKEIKFSLGSVVFDVDTISGRLKSIKVLDLNQNIIKEVKLWSRALSDRRSLLDSVGVFAGTQRGEVYRMDYNGGNVVFEPMSDYWGFVGPGQGLTSSVPSMISTIRFYRLDGPLGAAGHTALYYLPNLTNRDASFYTTSMFALKSIQYPTGGFSYFDYEQNRCVPEQTEGDNNLFRDWGNDDWDGNYYTGGLRIKTIKTVSGAGDIIYKHYRYGINETGGGYLPNLLIKEDFITEYKNRDFYGLDNYPTRTRVYSSSSARMIAYPNASSVRYPKVTEYTSSDENGLNVTGKTEHYFNVPLNTTNYGMGHPNFREMDLRDDWKTGEEYLTVYYKNGSAGFEKIKSTRNIYDIDIDYNAGTDIRHYVDTIRYHRYNHDGSVDLTWIPWDVVYPFYQYTLYPGSKTLSGVIDTTYSGGDFLVERSEFMYDQFMNLKTKKTTTSNGNKAISEFKYSWILPIFSGSNIVSRIVQQSDSVETASSTVPLATNEIVYGLFNGLVLPQSIQSRTGVNPMETKVLFGQYDQYGNILEQRKANDIKEIYLWGYKSRYPVAKITGSNYTTIIGVISQASIDAVTDVAGNDAAVRSLLQNIRTHFATDKTVQVSTYTYKPLVGITSETDPTGRTIYYEYDAFNRLKLQKDEQGNILKKYCYNYAGQPIDCQ